MEHPGASTADVVQATRISARTVGVARRQLRDAGLAMATGSGRPPEFVPPSVDGTPIKEQEEFDKQTAGELLAAAEKETGFEFSDITPEEMKRVLTRLIRNPGMPPQIRIAAITAKQKLDFDVQDKHALGPGAPLGKDDAVDRLASLMKACGPDIVHTAITVAFTPEVSNVTKETVDKGQPSPPPALLIEPLGSPSENRPTEEGGSS